MVQVSDFFVSQQTHYNVLALTSSGGLVSYTPTNLKGFRSNAYGTCFQVPGLPEAMVAMDDKTMVDPYQPPPAMYPVIYDLLIPFCM